MHCDTSAVLGAPTSRPLLTAAPGHPSKACLAPEVVRPVTRLLSMLAVGRRFVPGTIKHERVVTGGAFASSFKHEGVTGDTLARLA